MVIGLVIILLCRRRTRRKQQVNTKSRQEVRGIQQGSTGTPFVYQLPKSNTAPTGTSVDSPYDHAMASTGPSSRSRLHDGYSPPCSSRDVDEENFTERHGSPPASLSASRKGHVVTEWSSSGTQTRFVVHEDSGIRDGGAPATRVGTVSEQPPAYLD